MADQTLSVIVPAMNAAKTLPTLLDALLDLKTPPGWQMEIIAGYTDSGDNTLAVLEQRPIKIVHNTTIGPGAARNAAAKEARGELLYFIDADARPVGADFLIRLIRTAVDLNKRKKLGVSAGPVSRTPRNGQIRSPWLIILRAGSIGEKCGPRKKPRCFSQRSASLCAVRFSGRSAGSMPRCGSWRISICNIESGVPDFAFTLFKILP